MASRMIDIHPHIIADDDVRYPRAPLFGVQSDWSRTRPVTMDQYAKACDAVGIDKAAIVQASTCYGFDNSYLTDSIARYAGRFTGVGSLDLAAPDAPAQIERQFKLGITGLRIFTGGSTAAMDNSRMGAPNTYPAWERATELGISICLQTDAAGIPHVIELAKRFPKAKILLDHLARPDVDDGPPYAKAAPLFTMAPVGNIYLKVTPRIFSELRKGKADGKTFLPKVVSEFGASRLAWGSNYPSSEGSLPEIVATAKEGLSVLSSDDQAWIFSKTAQTLYPALAD